MELLNLKLLRDLRAGKRQFSAVAVVVALGITLYVGSAMSYQNLGASYDRSYHALGFADFTVACERAPDTVVARARALPGVEGVLGRWVEDLIIEKERPTEPGVRNAACGMRSTDKDASAIV